MSLPDLETLEPFSPELTDDYLEHHAVLPLGFEEGRLVVATWQDEVDAQALDDLRLLAGAPVELVRLPEPELRATVRTSGRHVVTVQGHRAGVDGHQSRARVERRRLTGAVRPDQTGDPAAGRGQAHIADRFEAAEAHRDPTSVEPLAVWLCTHVATALLSRP